MSSNVVESTIQLAPGPSATISIVASVLYFRLRAVTPGDGCTLDICSCVRVIFYSCGLPSSLDTWRINYKSVSYPTAWQCNNAAPMSKPTVANESK
eukprot:scaffold95_cov108-Alexandrium_tamarense.AAC.6